MGQGGSRILPSGGKACLHRQEGHQGGQGVVLLAGAHPQQGWEPLQPGEGGAAYAEAKVLLTTMNTVGDTKTGDDPHVEEESQGSKEQGPAVLTAAAWATRDP